MYTDLSNRHIWRQITLSHGLTRLGSKAWEFIIPIFLLTWSPSLWYPAIFGLSITFSKLFLAPRIGSWADKQSRFLVIKVGIGLQAIAVAGSSALLLFPRSTPLFASILFCGILEAMGATLSSSAVKKDWVPQLADNPQEQAEVNLALSRLDLILETLGPLWASFVVDFFGKLDNGMPNLGFTVVGLVNFASCIPELYLLWRVYCEQESKLRRAPDEARKTRSANVAEANKPGIRDFLTHRYDSAMLIIAYALMWFTALSPHGVVLTAFLKLRGMGLTHLALFRGVGAVSGILGANSLKWYAGGSLPNLIQKAALHYAWFLGMCTAVAVLSYDADIRIFIVAIVLSRVGLYGFDLGLSTIQQVAIEENQRMFMGAVETGLCSTGTSAVFIGSLIWSAPSQFIYLALSSSGFVISGCCVFSIWVYRWRYVLGEDYEVGRKKPCGHFERRF